MRKLCWIVGWGFYGMLNPITETIMFKILGYSIASEAEVQKMIDNCHRTGSNIAMSQVDTSKPLTDYERGRRDVAQEILLLVQPG